ncbi:hypothetical protein ACOIXN_004714 [Vibrio vulnificus]|uniref:hypothetical protein n=1 Tax=Vibrio vulnificus TaxID=672 RepID=UPI00092BB174|nr:hypothetical protein [Vibrio vulnificus]EHD2253267.1 hypothetical protein [Vibrio vulnificus]OJI27293.1 hypothetical protein VV99743_04080 [Vibrio vulnificus]
MGRPRNNRDNVLVIVGLALIFFGVKKLLGSEDYTSWFLYGGALVAAGILDPLLALTGKKSKEKPEQRPE